MPSSGCTRPTSSTMSGWHGLVWTRASTKSARRPVFNRCCCRWVSFPPKPHTANESTFGRFVRRQHALEFWNNHLLRKLVVAAQRFENRLQVERFHHSRDLRFAFLPPLSALLSRSG